MPEQHLEEDSVHVTARVPADLAKAFTRLATTQERSVSAELRRAMRAHLEGCHPAQQRAT